jgi:hypothetical protein
MHDSNRLLRLEREIKLLRIALLAGVFAVIALSAIENTSAQTAPPSVLRVRGLIVEDAQGRPRIMIGAPVPTAAGRVRNDSAFGLLYLNENGLDQVALGDVPDPQVLGTVRKRIRKSVGIVLNDSKGDERAGFGVTENGVVLGLDYPGKEALTLFASPAGYTGITMNLPPGRGGNEQLGMVLNNQNGTSVMKLSGPDGSERIMFSVESDHAKARFADGGASLKDVTAILQP